MRKLIIPFLLVLLLLNIVIGFLVFYKRIDFKSSFIDIGTYCVVFGVLGGIVQCFRGYYLHAGVYKDWDDNWNIWYYIRPVVSGILGFVSLVFIKAGLFVFSSEGGNNLMAYLAVAFIAGYNVQNFLTKLEEISKATLSIEKSSSRNK